MSKIFICHSSEDNDISEQIQLALLNAGHDVFFDASSLPPGGDYNERIQKAIIACDLFIFLISQHSIREGKYTLTELKIAKEKWPSPKNRILSVRIDKTDLIAVPNYLKTTTLLEVSGNAAAEVRIAVDKIVSSSKRSRITASAIAIFVITSVGLVASFHKTDAVIAEKPIATPLIGEISFKSDKGDFIGEGKIISLNNKNGKLSSTATKRSISIYYEGDDSWNLVLTAPENNILTVGKYESAQREPFQNPLKPGLSFSGSGRGCNELSGRFEITKIEFVSDTQIKELEGNFEQHCDNLSPGLYGKIQLTKEN